MRSKLAVFLGLLGLYGLSIAECRADDYLDAVSLYDARQYSDALGAFRKVVERDPENASANYYAALCLHRLGFPDQARLLYERVIERFPKTEAARLAQQGLGSLSLHGKTLAPGRKEEFHDVLTAPSQSWIPFDRRGNSVIMDASLSRTHLRMLFDTGASQTVLGFNHLKNAKIPLPSGPPDGTALGVGSSKPIPYWTARVDLTVGKIRRQNFPVVVHEHMDIALLGQTFYRDFEYEVDNASRAIGFKRRDNEPLSRNATLPAGHVTVNSSGQYVYTVPFTREGNEIVVEVQVNGKPCRMYFDTGASVCFFPPASLQALGLSIPNYAARTQLTGIGGDALANTFAISHMKLGPIDKNNVLVTSSSASTADKPLLGQNFFNDWQFTIDNKNTEIRFLRK